MKHWIIGSILGSMALGSIPVKTNAQDLLSTNKDSQDSRADLKTPVKDVKSDWSHFIQTVINSCQESEFRDGLAQAIGLPGPMPTKTCHISITGHSFGDDRDVHVVYSTVTSEQNRDGKRPVCIYLHRGHSTKHELKANYFRISLDGKLEKAITLQNKIDDNGKGLSEGRARFENDIQDPEIQKIFKTEMAYWLKKWLRKQRNVKTDTSKLKEIAVGDHSDVTHRVIGQETTTPSAKPAQTAP